MNDSKVNKEIKNIFITIISAVISALVLHMFVAPAEFAPAGVDGLAIMLQYITDISMGWFTLLINIPLLIGAWFILNKRYVIYTVLFTILSSVFLVILQKVEFYQFNFPQEKLLIALVSGAILGVRTGLMLKIESSTGGIDVLAGFIQKANKHINVENIITVICCSISVISVFVYKDVLSILLSLIQMFVFDRFAGIVLTDIRNAVEFKVITQNPDKLIKRIITELKHGATVVESKGAFSDDNSSIILTVVNNRQIPHFLNMVEEENAFVYYTEVKGVKGNFRWRRDDEVK